MKDPKDWKNWKLRGKRVMVRREDPDEVSEGGILLPPEARELPNTYVVLAIGPEVEGVLPGDVIGAMPFAITDMAQFPKQSIGFLSCDNVAAVLDREEPEDA